MTLSEFYSGLTSLDLPVTYRRYAEGEAPGLPYLVYYVPGSNNFEADGKVYLKVNEINIELYSKTKDIDNETKIEDWLDENDIFYEKIETTDSAGTVTYATPVAIPGAVSISLEAQGGITPFYADEAQGGITPFYADGIKYYNADTNAGYEGDLEMALITDVFREDILGETLDTNSVMIENADVNGSEFALGFQIDGDEKGTRFWFYNCNATRPSTESSTTEDTKEPTTDTITCNFKSSAAVPRIYRIKFHRDIFVDFSKIEKSIRAQEKIKEESGEDVGSSIPIESLEMFENIAYIMHKHGDSEQPDTIDEWLEQFETFDIYQRYN
ncbi:hypothetical protein QE152_g38974 [Popillia japonica]|uniref:Uncharacterized protein n=1 Tax=Popillia japonica TaxID=7064 RepID=A0AAW1HV06_POPJA